MRIKLKYEYQIYYTYRYVGSPEEYTGISLVDTSYKLNTSDRRVDLGRSLRRVLEEANEGSVVAFDAMSYKLLKKRSWWKR